MRKAISLCEIVISICEIAISIYEMNVVSYFVQFLYFNIPNGTYS